MNKPTLKTQTVKHTYTLVLIDEYGNEIIHHDVRAESPAEAIRMVYAAHFN